jgi:hypothetical protein
LNHYVALVNFPEGSGAGAPWSDAKFFFPASFMLAVVVSLQRIPEHLRFA